MKKEEKEVRRKMVVVRFNAREYEQLQALRKRTTERTLSAYLRKVALAKPLVVTYRNTTGDDFLRDMVALKKELQFIGHNYNQAVKRLHLLERIPEFRGWILKHEKDYVLFHQKISEINNRVSQLYEQWLQK